MRPVSRAEFARLAGVSSPAITKASKGKLAPACVGDRIDVDHPAAKAYLGDGRAAARVSARAPTKSPKQAQARTTQPPASRRGAEKPNPKAPPNRPRSTRSSETAVEHTDDFELYADTTLRELVEQFGTIRSLRDCVEALKKIEDTRGKRLDNDELEGKLVSREAVRTHIVGAMHSVFERLLRDAPRTLVARLAPMAKSGEANEVQERVARELISSILKPALDGATRSVRKLK